MELKILIVEDSEVIRQMERKTLSELGYSDVTEAENGSVAIDILGREKGFDLIISDWNMPEKSGYDLLLWIRSSDEYKSVPFILATAQGDRTSAQIALDAGASCVIPKPFDASELNAKIDELLGEGESERGEHRPDKAASDKAVLRVAHIQITDHLLLGVLKHLIGSRELNPVHFQLDTHCMTSWNLVEQALVKGSVDAAFILAPIAMDQFGFGDPIRLILLAHKNGSIFVRRKDESYNESPGDFFTGKSFLIPHKMSVHHMLSHMYFREHGLKSGVVGDEGIHVHYEVVAPIHMPAYLDKNPDSGGFMVAEPIGSKAIASGTAESQFLSGEIWPDHPCCVVVMRDEFIERHTDAAFEFTRMLVQAGKMIEQRPDAAAKIGVGFLDPSGSLGFQPSLLERVLREKNGIQTGDLFPVVGDLERIQRYMHDEMGIGRMIDVASFVDLRFAEAALRGESSFPKPHTAPSDIGESQPAPHDADTDITKPEFLPDAEIRKIKILLIEDSVTMRKMELKTLNRMGFENVIEAEDGVAAIAKLLTEDDIGLIICDWNMPRKNGYEVLQWVRGNDNHRSAPFLMATAQGDREQAKKAFEAGATGLIAKPFEADELETKIYDTLGIRVGEEKPEESGIFPRRSVSGKVRLRTAHIQITDHLILGVLRHLIDTGQLTPKHFELETRCVGSWNPVEDALEKGSVEAAFILAPIAMDLFGFGVPIKLALLAHRNGSIFVRNKLGQNESAKTYFKGKSFLIPHKMSVHHVLSHMFFSQSGLKPGVMGDPGIDVHFEVVAPVDMPRYLKENTDCGGFMVAEPLGTKTIASGIADLQFLSGTMWKNHPCCVLAMREDFIEKHEDAAYEFVQMLAHAGKLIDQDSRIASRVGVDFLDPLKLLGFKIPLIQNVLTECQGIKTGNLFPEIEDFERIQKYMVDSMGIGKRIDLEKFIDTRFAEAVGLKMGDYEEQNMFAPGTTANIFDNGIKPTPDPDWDRGGAGAVSLVELERLVRISDELARIGKHFLPYDNHNDPVIRNMSPNLNKLAVDIEDIIERISQRSNMEISGKPAREKDRKRDRRWKKS